ncbi:VWA domain-containing protein [Roseomonas sp. NAR14]|uniref:VWA domain-containing protein n=1 Tax=Roseomonas acroporae TaxID=2937791 RepID=A0A9X2BUU4_9PROT|nr:VWA domain-containing protein [Roseomonas acroporae]MCK8785922.1 VWA domain-containing protein [Roseomonas acroporae]
MTEPPTTNGMPGRSPPLPPPPWPSPRRHRFLPALALASLAAGLPLAALAGWWGFELAAALHGSDSAREAICRVPPGLYGDLRAEETDLRRRVAELEGDLARRRAQCRVCADPEAVDVALVVDTSASMRWPATMDAAAERARIAQIEREAGPVAEPRGNDRFLAELNRTPPAQQRMEAARRAALAALEGLPARARVQLLSFAGAPDDAQERPSCTVAPVGSFPGPDRAPLQSALRALRPDASGTPLAQAIERGAAAVRARPEGVPGMVVVITDGVESCRGDPCAAARAARAADPGLAIAVVDIARNEQIACLAEATGGRVFAPEAGADLGRLLAERLRAAPQNACIPRASR